MQKSRKIFKTHQMVWGQLNTIHEGALDRMDAGQVFRKRYGARKAFFERRVSSAWVWLDVGRALC